MKTCGPLFEDHAWKADDVTEAGSLARLRCERCGVRPEDTTSYAAARERSLREILADRGLWPDR